jgi:hypothetical protein
MKLNLKSEPNIKAWVYRGLIGPAGIVDGIIYTLTVGTVIAGLALATSKSLAKARIQTEK